MNEIGRCNPENTKDWNSTYSTYAFVFCWQFLSGNVRQTFSPWALLIKIDGLQGHGSHLQPAQPWISDTYLSENRISKCPCHGEICDYLIHGFRGSIFSDLWKSRFGLDSRSGMFKSMFIHPTLGSYQFTTGWETVAGLVGREAIPTELLVPRD